MKLGGRAIGDAGEIHARVGVEEEVEVFGEGVVLSLRERDLGAGGELVPEVVHDVGAAMVPSGHADPRFAAKRKFQSSIRSGKIGCDLQCLAPAKCS